jgi:uncharacterized membrane protein
MSTPEHLRRQTFDIARFNALTDGVFAIVLTLLVLELKLPDTAAGVEFLDVLSDDWHVFVAWVISFVLIARFWIVHHAVTAQMHRCHLGTIVLNFGVLGVVSLMPFTADAVGTGRIAEPWATVAFAVNVGLLSLAVGALARHVQRDGSVHHPGLPPHGLDRHRRHHLYLLPAVTAGAVVLAFVQPFAAVGVLFAEVVWAGWRGLRGTG